MTATRPAKTSDTAASAVCTSVKPTEWSPLQTEASEPTQISAVNPL